MIDFQDLKPDCRHFRPDRPCDPHKSTGVTCPSCETYDPCTRRVLVVKLAALGDVLRTTSLLPAIRAKYAGAHVTWLTDDGAVDLLRDNRSIDEVWGSGSAVTTARLRNIEFDTVLCPDADPEAVALAAAARCGERFGFTLDSRGRVIPLGAQAEHWYRMGLSDPLKRKNDQTYQTLVARALALDPGEVGRPTLEPSSVEVAAAARLVDGFGFDGPLIGLNTGSGGRWEFKQWTLENQRGFIELASKHGAGVVLLGGPNESARHRELLSTANGAPVFDAGTSHTFGRFAAIVDRCKAIVSGDTFAMHVATAREIPAVVLFGPTSAVEIELYGPGDKILPEGLDCLGCYLPRCDVTPHCQARISPEMVWSAVHKYVPDS